METRRICLDHRPKRVWKGICEGACLVMSEFDLAAVGRELFVIESMGV